MAGKPKSKKPVQLPNTTPIVIDGDVINTAMLIEFLDWSIANNTKDFQMFKHLYNTGYFKTHPVTAQALQKAAEALAEK